MNQIFLATKRFRMTKTQENAVLNIFSENSCLTREMAALPILQVEFVVIPYIFSLCWRLSAVDLSKADVFVAMR